MVTPVEAGMAASMTLSGAAVAAPVEVGMAASMTLSGAAVAAPVVVPLGHEGLSSVRVGVEMVRRLLPLVEPSQIKS